MSIEDFRLLLIFFFAGIFQIISAVLYFNSLFGLAFLNSVLRFSLLL